MINMIKFQSSRAMKCNNAILRAGVDSQTRHRKDICEISQRVMLAARQWGQRSKPPIRSIRRYGVLRSGGGGGGGGGGGCRQPTRSMTAQALTHRLRRSLQ